jgi:hypothetical protein
MERVKALINKLHEQSLQNADAASLQATVQQLQTELFAYASTSPSKQLGTSKVAVVMPSMNRMSTVTMPPPVTYEEVVVAPEPKKTAEKTIEKNYQPVPKKEEEHEDSGWLFDPLKEIPTLAHQEYARELNDVIGQNGASLNDRLKTEKTEMMEVLTEAPIRDLKRAIGINDRYVFVNELFRGDEAMYERSIKTINSFRILPEAEYWMDREMKVKLGWDESKPITQHFYQLVRRRFS